MNRFIVFFAVMTTLVSCSSAEKKSSKMPEEKIIAEDNSGEINGQVIRERLVVEQAKLGECYVELKIPYNSKEEVVALAEFVIQPENGQVSEVAIIKTTHIVLGQCLERVLRKTAFTGLSGTVPVRVKQNFNFTAE